MEVVPLCDDVWSLILALVVDGPTLRSCYMVCRLWHAIIDAMIAESETRPLQKRSARVWQGTSPMRRLYIYTRIIGTGNIRHGPYVARVLDNAAYESVYEVGTYRFGMPRGHRYIRRGSSTMWELWTVGTGHRLVGRFYEMYRANTVGRVGEVIAHERRWWQDFNPSMWIVTDPRLHMKVCYNDSTVLWARVNYTEATHASGTWTFASNGTSTFETYWQEGISARVLTFNAHRQLERMELGDGVLVCYWVGDASSEKVSVTQLHRARLVSKGGPFGYKVLYDREGNIVLRRWNTRTRHRGVFGPTTIPTEPPVVPNYVFPVLPKEPLPYPKPDEIARLAELRLSIIDRVERTFPNNRDKRDFPNVSEYGGCFV